MNCTLCNMCMIEDAATGHVLVQHRLAKPTNPWCGLTFPGGHVEAGESITASTVREIREETGLTVSNLRMCGVVEWETIGKRTDGSPAEVANDSKYIVFMFRTSTFTGELKSSAEGQMEWMTLDEMRKGGLAPHMEEYIRVMVEDDVPQAYGISGSGLLGIVGGKALVQGIRIVAENERPNILIGQLLAVWESSVKATHTFLSPAEIEDIKKYVPKALNSVPHLATARTEENIPVAFMGVDGDKLEMLFVATDRRGNGIGKTLLMFGIENLGVRQLTVNEQNPQARGFYEYMGFEVFDRTDIDEQGNPYPLLYMRLKEATTGHD